MLAGTKVTSQTEQLRKITVDYLYNSIRNPKPEIANCVRTLRLARSVDAARYAKLKRELPYFVCGVFNPPFRHSDNFAYTEHFVVDIDHIAEKGLDMEALRESLSRDPRVLLMFTSPSNDGLKVMFQLQERCTEKAIYSQFYKKFALELSRQHNLEQVIDGKTSDVARACFISVDPQAYYNPNAEPVNLKSYVDEADSMMFFEEQRAMKEVAKQQAAVAPPEPRPEPSTDELAKIKEILKQGRPKAQKPPVYVPQQLNDVIEDLKKHIEATGVVVTEVLNISYAKKIRMRTSTQQAEVNVFYGKRGYSVVASPRSGTSAELNELMKEHIESYFFS